MIAEKIKMDKEIITENKIEISSRECSTNFCNFTRYEYPSISELEKEVKALRKELRDKGVSLSRTDTLKTLRERKDEYNKKVKEYNDTFNQLLVAWQNKLHIGLYAGYGSDEYYTEVLRPLNFKLQEMNYRDCILSIIKEIQYDVRDIKAGLKEGKEYIKVSL